MNKHIVGLILACSSFMAPIEAKQVNILCLDWDGVFQYDPSFAGYFNRALDALPHRLLAAQVLWQIKGEFARAFWRMMMQGEFVFCDKNGNPLRGNKANIEYLCTISSVLRDNMEAIKNSMTQEDPILLKIKMIQQQQAEGALLIVWTNNDAETLQKKLAHVNEYLREIGWSELTFDGVFVLGSDENENESSVGKPDPAYYKKAYAYSQKIVEMHGLDPEACSYFFIDDKPKNLAQLPHGVVAIHAVADDVAFMRIFTAAMTPATALPEVPYKIC